MAGGPDINPVVMVDNRLSITYDEKDLEEINNAQTLLDGGSSPMKQKKRVASPRAGSMRNRDEQFVMFNDFPIKFATRHRNKAAFVEESVQGNQLLIAMSSQGSAWLTESDEQ